MYVYGIQHVCMYVCIHLYLCRGFHMECNVMYMECNVMEWNGIMYIYYI